MNRKVSSIAWLIVISLSLPLQLSSRAVPLQSNGPTLPPGKGAWLLRIGTHDGRWAKDWRLNRFLNINSQGDIVGTGLLAGGCKPRLSSDELQTIGKAISSAAPSAWTDILITDSCTTTVTLSQRDAAGMTRTYRGSWLCPGKLPPSVPKDLAAIYETADSIRSSVIKRCQEEQEHSLKRAKSSTAHLRPEHREVVETWLVERSELRLAGDEDYFSRKELAERRTGEANFHPYYAVGGYYISPFETDWN